jgi:hypothetical protein
MKGEYSVKVRKMSATTTMKKSQRAVDEGESRHEVDEVKSRCMVGKGRRVVR